MPGFRTKTINESHVQGWYKVCKKPCIKFDPVDFVEFAGRRGIDALIIERDGRMAFLLAPMPNRKFRILMQEYMKERMEVGKMEREKPRVKLVGMDGNAFSILSRVKTAMKKGGWSKKEIENFLEEAMSGDYDHLLQTVIKYCEVE